MKLFLYILCSQLMMPLSYAIKQRNPTQNGAEAILIREHIPLMQGLKVTGEIEDIGYESDFYRIEAEASGNIFLEDIEEFYQDSLPTYGWERIGRFAYVLKERYLEIIPQNKGGMLMVIFQLRSKIL